MSKKTKEELLLGYFQATLSKSEFQEFNTLLEGDTAFREEYLFRKELQQALQKKELNEAAKYLHSLRSDNPMPKKKNPFGVWLIAASTIVLLGLAWWIYDGTTSSETDLQQLYVQYYEPYENVVHPIERASQMQDLTDQAFAAYENEDYATAVRLFENLKEQNQDPYLVFYQGIGLMALDQHLEAQEMLQTYIREGGELKNRALWYLGLSYLKTDNPEAAKKALKPLADTTDYKSDQARRILEVLD